jgi:DNA polymerase III delta prime subunit
MEENLGRKPLGNRPLEWQRRRAEDNIKMDLREIGCEDGRWLEVAEERIQWRALVLRMLELRVLLPHC